MKFCAIARDAKGHAGLVVFEGDTGTVLFEYLMDPVTPPYAVNPLKDALPVAFEVYSSLRAIPYPWYDDVPPVDLGSTLMSMVADKQYPMCLEESRQRWPAPAQQRFVPEVLLDAYQVMHVFMVWMNTQSTSESRVARTNNIKYQEFWCNNHATKGMVDGRF